MNKTDFNKYKGGISVQNKPQSDSISLDNFDPFNLQRILTSPCSIKICEENGIEINKLVHTAYEEIKNQTHPLKRNDSQYLRNKYIEVEEQRQKLVDQLKKIRRAVLEHSIGTTSSGLKSETRSSSMGANRNKSKYSSYIAQNKENDYHNERSKLETNMAKELQMIIKQANLSTVTDTRLGSYINPKRNKSELGKSSPKIADALLRIKKAEKVYNEYKENQVQVIRQKRILHSLHDEQQKEMKSIMKKVSDYKREQLLERINNYYNKTECFKKQKEELYKLRQRMRKEAAFQKYIIKNELEKSMIQFKVLKFFIIGTKIRLETTTR